MMKWVSKIAGIATICVVVVGASSCDDAQAEQQSAPAQQAATADVRVYREMASTAWRYLDRYYQPSTGFVNATPDWFNTTLWDIGGQLLAQHGAMELGLLEPGEYRKRTQTALNTLERLTLYDGVTYNRVYSTKDGAPDMGSGAGWSATDVGRLLVALKVLSVREPAFAEQIQRIVRRTDLTQVVKGGYLHGRVKGQDGKPSNFQEGRLGYEQYVAAGFGQWGADVRNALNFRQNVKPVEVQGVKLFADKRGLDRLLSEPFILQGLELGLDGAYRDFAARVLQAQEARYRATGQVTIVSEDAIAVPPHHFYYYCVLCNGKPFAVGISSPRQTLDEPRWVSVKGAYGWHAIMPSDYTKVAVDYVAPALDSKNGWATGVYEKTRASTKTWDVNTAAVLLEIAWFQLRGRKPLIQAAPVASASGN